MSVAINDGWYRNSQLRMEAEGYQWRNASHGRGPTLVTESDPDAPGGYVVARTGGLVVMRPVPLQEDHMFRFAAKKYLGSGTEALVPLLNSPWWMNDDRMVLLISRAREARVPLVEMARRQLALPPAWTDCDIIVSARLRRGIQVLAHAGPGITAEGGGQRYVIAREAPHLFMDQLYVPGLGRHPALGGAGMANARAWFDLSSARSYDPNARGFNP